MVLKLKNSFCCDGCANHNVSEIQVYLIYIINNNSLNKNCWFELNVYFDKLHVLQHLYGVFVYCNITLKVHLSCGIIICICNNFYKENVVILVKSLTLLGKPVGYLQSVALDLKTGLPCNKSKWLE